jgi:hypothetical protein
MPAKAAPRGAVATPVNAVVPTTLDNEELLKLLGDAKMLPSAGEGNFRRMSLKGGSLVTDPGQPDEESWPPTRKGPTMTVRIVKPPIYYNAFFLSSEEKNGSIDANRIGRPDLNGKFVKKYDDPAEQAADDWANVDAYDALVQATNGNRGQFKGDIQLQILPEDGEFKGDEPIYTLTLSSSSAIDFRGTRKNQSGGVVQEKNFIVQLAELAQQQAIEAGAGIEDIPQAILNAMTAFRLGGVVAEIYLIVTTSQKDPSISWTVIAFKPIYIESGSEQAALPSGEGDDLTIDPDDLPF